MQFTTGQREGGDEKAGRDGDGQYKQLNQEGNVEGCMLCDIIDIGG